MPVSSTEKDSQSSPPVSDPRGAQRDGAVLGELRGIADEVQQALAHLHLVGVHGAEVRGQRQHEAVALPGDEGGRRRHDLVDHRLHGEGHGLHGHAAGLDLRQVEHVVDEAEQVAGVGLDLLHVLDEPAMAELLDLLRHHAAVADHGGQRRSQLVAHVGDELALGAVGALGRLAGRFEPRLGGALLRDVRVDADPFAHRVRGIVEGRHGADREGAVEAAAHPHPMLEHEGLALRQGLAPGVDRRLRVVGQQGRDPSLARVFAVGLARQGFPALLGIDHAALGVGGPQHALHGRDGGPEARFRAAALAVLGVERAEQARVVDRHGGLGREADDEALLALGEAPRFGVAEEQRPGDAGGARHHRRRHVAPHRQMALGHATHGAVAGVVRHVVRADHALVAEARAEQRRFARQAEARESGERRARQARELPHFGLARRGDHALEEGAVPGARQPRGGVDDRLGEGVEVEVGRQRDVELAQLLHLGGEAVGRRGSAVLVDVGHAGSCGVIRSRLHCSDTTLRPPRSCPSLMRLVSR